MADQIDTTVKHLAFQPTVFPVGKNPVSMVAGDLDGDGDNDLAVANKDSNDISVLLNGPGSLFSPGGSFKVAKGPVSLVARDLNGDGDLDLAVANQTPGSITVLKNNGKAGFEIAADYHLGDNSTYLAAADFDGDGNQDLVSVGNSLGVSVLRNQGDGTFAEPGAKIAVGVNPVFVSAVDLDDDGRPDLEVACQGDYPNPVGNVSVIWNEGEGKFGDAVSLALLDAPGAIAAGDMNADGKTDLAVSRSGVFGGSRGGSLMLNEGDRRFASPMDLDIGGSPKFIIVADIDADGDFDLVTANWNQYSLSVLLNDGHGTFTGPLDFLVAQDPFFVLAADLNGDSAPDLAALKDTSKTLFNEEVSLVSVLINQPASTSRDCNANGIPDECEISTGAGQDCNQNGIIDECEISSDPSIDCNRNGVPDECDIRLRFRPETELPVGKVPASMAAGDLNGDGHLDLALVSQASSTISVMWNKGNGLFDTPEELSVEAPQVVVTVADLNLDGNFDLAAAGSFIVSVLLNQRPGSFLPAVSLPVGSNPNAMMAGDLNGDGDTDLATANALGDRFPGNVSVLLSNGDGTFEVARNFGAQRSPSALAGGDLDQDGDLDLAVANRGSSSVSVFWNDGRGLFTERADVDLGAAPLSIAAADLDGDKDLDLAVGYLDSPLISFLLNRGDRTFPQHKDIQVGLPQRFVAASDFDGDGDVDLAITTDEVSVLYNCGDMTFKAVASLPGGSRAFSFSPAGLIAGDLDGDGDPDLAVGNEREKSVIVVPNDGKGRFFAQRLPAKRPNSLLAADLDGDGDVDLALANSGGAGGEWGEPGDTVTLLLNDGRGILEPADEVQVGLVPDSLTIADLDGDGNLDLGVTNAGTYTNPGQTLSVLLNSGKGKFEVAVTILVGESPHGVASGDLDGDGDMDMAVAVLSPTGKVVLVRNEGRGAFSLGKEYNLERSPYSVVAIDFNGDAAMDLAVAGALDGLAVSLNNGKGDFLSWKSYLAEWGPKSLTATDLDGDGDQDLVWGHGGSYSPPSLSMVFNEGNGLFLRQGGLDFGERAWSVTASDLDGDGDSDLIGVSNTSKTIAIFRNQGQSKFLRPETFVFAPKTDTVALTPVTTADLDQDGDNDVIVGGLGEVLVLWNGAVQPLSVDANENGIPDECESGEFQRGDANADGRYDLTDALFILGFLFLGNPTQVPCERSADSDDNGTVNLTDVVRLLEHLFLSGAPPARPFPSCGIDSTADELTCQSYLPCK